MHGANGPHNGTHERGGRKLRTYFACGPSWPLSRHFTPGFDFTRFAGAPISFYPILSRILPGRKTKLIMLAWPKQMKPPKPRPSPPPLKTVLTAEKIIAFESHAGISWLVFPIFD
jgi:hypothetical protein